MRARSWLLSRSFAEPKPDVERPCQVGSAELAELLLGALGQRLVGFCFLSRRGGGFPQTRATGWRLLRLRPPFAMAVAG
jgi:hypothetical protein